VAVYLTMFFS